MKVELRDISSLKPYPANPRRNEGAVAAVAESIRRYGWRVPIVVDREGVIVCGHTRLLAAERLGLTEVPVHIAHDLTPEQARAYRIADNRSSEISEWNMDLLPIELAELKALDFPIDSLGWSQEELDGLLAPPGTDGACDPDDVPEPPEEPITQRGDLWLLGGHRLLCGDSTDLADVQRVMDGKKAVMMFADPPWNVAIGGDGNPRHRQRACLVNDDLPPDQFAAFLRAFIGAATTVVSGDVYCVLGASEWPALDLAMRSCGFHWSATVIWVKHAFVLGRSNYHRRYEPIWYGWQKKSSYTAARDADDVWEMDRPTRSPDHATTKPVELVARAIVHSSKKGGLVYEPFSGSGTTIIACEQQGRRCFAIEIEPRYVDCAVARWEQFTGKKAERVPANSQSEKAPKRSGAKEAA